MTDAKVTNITVALTYEQKFRRYLNTGDLSGFTEEEIDVIYRGMCDKYGLDVQFRPFDLISFKGKLCLYMTSKGVDQLAYVKNISRVATEGPEVRTFDGKKMVYCKVIATLPTGRKESSTAAIGYTGNVADTDIMKCETKAKRRATLAVLSLGVFVEDEVDSLPGATYANDPKQLEAANVLNIHVQRCLASPVLLERDADTGKSTEAAKAAFLSIATDYSRESGIPMDDAKRTLGAAVVKAREPK